MSAPTVAGLRLADVQLYLAARGFTEAYPDAVFIRGLGDANDLTRAGAGRAVIMSRAGGPGLRSEMHFDQPIVTLRVVGKQQDYDDAEQMAIDADAAMLSGEAIMVGSSRALWVVRAGGGPAHIQTDKARRAHFSCSYIIPVASGL